MSIRSRLTGPQKVRLFHALAAAQMVAARPFGRDLDRLARIFGTDKSSRGHGYTRRYAQHLPPRREVRTLLEIGIGGTSSVWGYETPVGGQSLRMWQRYYPRATVVGLDIERKVVHGRRIVVEQGSQADPEVLERVARCGPFDVIVDDGSHIGEHVQASFRALWPHLRPGGVYVIEDLSTSYQPAYGGGPPGTPGTHSELLREMVDAVLGQHWDGPTDVAELHVYDQIAFLRRA